MHRYDDELRSMAASPAQETSALAKNLTYDNRVSEARERVLDAFVPKPCAPGDLLKGLTDYYRARVQTPDHPDYLDPSLNAENLVDPFGKPRRSGEGAQPGHDVLPVIKPNWLFVRVLDINSLVPVLQWALSRSVESWTNFLRPFVTVRDDESMCRWLDRKLLGAGPPAKNRFVATLIDIINEHVKAAPTVPPTYAMPWKPFETLVHAGPERWLEIAGEPRLTSPQWVLLLGYTAAEIGGIVRPTQLDACGDPYRCPPHRNAPVTCGAHPVDFGCPGAFQPLIPQYIHQPIQHTIEHWQCLGSWLMRAEPIGKKLTSRELSKKRERHYRRMEREYGRSGIPLP